MALDGQPIDGEPISVKGRKRSLSTNDDEWTPSDEDEEQDDVEDSPGRNTRARTLRKRKKEAESSTSSAVTGTEVVPATLAHTPAPKTEGACVSDNSETGSASSNRDKRGRVRRKNTALPTQAVEVMQAWWDERE